MNNQHAVAGLTSHRAGPLIGTISVPGDKSISIRSLLFGALALDMTEIAGLLEGEDVLMTAGALRALGVPIDKSGDRWVVRGVGVGGFSEPTVDLDFGNSGTGSRLVMGAIAGNAITARIVGDASLSKRPMGRVLKPLIDMGLIVTPAGAERFPLTLAGTLDLMPTTYRLPVASAQVKSAIMIAGLHASGVTTVIEPEPTRDHTERMLRAFGVEVDVRTDPSDGARHISVRGRQTLRGQTVHVPRDPSSAAFPVVAAILVPGSDVTIEGVLVNPTRVGLYLTLQDMGADLTFANARVEGGEPVADIRVRSSQLRGVEVPAERAPTMIDEYPILSIAAAFASGTTTMNGLAELKVKESDRLAATADGLVANGIDARVDADRLLVTGMRDVPGGGLVETHLDHRIAMAFLVLGLASQRAVAVSDASPIATSFPTFRALFEEMGARFTDGDGR
ncbi:MAG: 3-phosphoshikimate 1-carboxyvinyltransferase [Hyphomicrobiaceae bacterium]